MTIFSLAPLALAVRIYSWRIVSSMAERVRRRRLAAEPSETVMVGKMKLAKDSTP